MDGWKEGATKQEFIARIPPNSPSPDQRNPLYPLFGVKHVRWVTDL
jgi:hypothetical protein